MIKLLYLATAGLLFTGLAAANEFSHGGLSETMGLGHRHMADYGGYHCAGPTDAGWEQHMQHMQDTHCGQAHMGGHGAPHHMGAGTGAGGRT